MNIITNNEGKINDNNNCNISVNRVCNGVNNNILYNKIN